MKIPATHPSGASCAPVALPLLVLWLLLGGCAGPPRIGECDPWYETESDLELKAHVHREHTQSLVNDSGLLLYRSYLPWGAEGEMRRNYLDSHDIADALAWHGLEMASLAFEWAVTGESRDAELARMADGLLGSYAIAGEPGVIVRSYMSDYAGPRLEWMETPEEEPTKPWIRGEGGNWYRAGGAKNHFNLAVFGCAMPLALDRRGEIELSTETRDRLVEYLVPAVRRFVEGGFRLRDADGTLTRFGDLRPDVALSSSGGEIPGLGNGFNRALALHVLCSARPYDCDIARVYERVARRWAPSIGNSMELVGEVIAAVGHWNFDRPSYSDMSAFSLAAFSLLLQEPRRPIARHVRRGLSGLWEFMRYEHNAMFTLPYSTVRPVDESVSAVVTSLRRFPMPEHKRAFPLGRVSSKRFQPIHNRPPSSNYWKSSPFRTIEADRIGVLADESCRVPYYASQDYTLAYWMGRYVGGVPAH